MTRIPAEILPFQLRHQAPWYSFMGGMIPFCGLHPFFGGGELWLTVLMALAGGVFGLWAQYRGRFGVLASLVPNLLVMLLVVSITLGAVGTYFAVANGQPARAQRLALGLLACLLVAGLFGGYRGWRAIAADPSGWLAERVDAGRQLLKPVSPSRPPFRYWIAPLAVACWPVFEASGLGRYWPLLLLSPVLVLVATWTVFVGGGEIVSLCALRRHEVRHGLRLTRFPPAAVWRQRRQLPLARYLCRREDLLEPAPLRARGRRAGK